MEPREAEKEALRREFIDPRWPAHTTAWRLCVTPGPELRAELKTLVPLGGEVVMFEGSRGRCTAIFEEAPSRFPHAAEGTWCLRQVRLEPYGQPVPLGGKRPEAKDARRCALEVRVDGTRSLLADLPEDGSELFVMVRARRDGIQIRKCASGWWGADEYLSGE